jgi:SAM-dependent MidA family methyltransferase
MDDDRDTPVPALVRVPLPDPESVGEDEVLVERLRAAIAAQGPISFARFMARALYEPGHGYYRRPDPGPGPAGDFLTAPETHPIFGAAVGRLLEEAWVALGRPGNFTVVEHGAGTGALAEGLLASLRDAGSPLLSAIRYRPVEVELARLEAFRARLEAAGLGAALDASDAQADGPPAVGAVVANEVLDALPVHRVIGRPGGVREQLVGLDATGAFAWVEADPTTAELAGRLRDEAIELEDGQAAEVCLGIDTWLAGAVDGLDRGVVVLIDYAEEPGSLYAPRRRDGTLRGFARHGVGGDPFRHVGRQDLTATVDLAAVRDAADRAGLVPLGETTQAELLAATSGEVAAATLHRPGATLEDGLLLRSALARLLDPRGMGGYRVLCFGRGLPAGSELASLRRLSAPGG